jgi:pSer/pThr/pTyr-binding forkhead associated (FHA) protein
VFQLREGENVVGRGESADVRLASSSVSRRHARISIESGTTVIEDLRSRNGTMARDERVRTPTRLNDGDAVRFGVVWLVYRYPACEGSNDEP